MGARTRDLINVELEFGESGADPDAVGGMRLNGGALKFRDSVGKEVFESGRALHSALEPSP